MGPYARTAASMGMNTPPWTLRAINLTYCPVLESYQSEKGTRVSVSRRYFATGRGNYGEFGSDGRDDSVYLQVDLGEVKSISQINLYRYWLDGRVYRGTVIVSRRWPSSAQPTWRHICAKWR